MPFLSDKNRKWWILAAMGGVIGLVVFDETVVGVALPTIRDDLGMSQVTSHWVINAYLLVFTGFALAGGRLGDILGHYGFFVAGAAVFGLASCASGFAQDSTWLITARLIQGIGAAIIFPASVAMLTAVFPPEQRGLALGIQTAVGGTFIMLGPVGGGFITEMFSWRWIFWITLPVVAAIALIVLFAWKGGTTHGKRPKLDVVGLIGLLGGLGALVIAIMQGTDWGWSSPWTLGLLLGGVVILLFFITFEHRTAEPLIELGLFRKPTFASGNLVIFAAQWSQISIAVFAVLYLQNALKMSPLTAGLALLAGMAPTPFVAVAAGRLADRLGDRRIGLIGLILNAIALTAFGLGLVLKSYAVLVAPLLLWGVSLPCLYVASRRAVMGSVPLEMRGEAGGISLTAQLLGGTVGIAISSMLLSLTDDYRIIFLAAAGVMFATFLIAWAQFASTKPS